MRRSDASAARATQQQLHNAKAKYAKLKAQVKKRIGQLKTRYANLRSELNECEESDNPSCLLALQSAMSRYETFLERVSELISAWETEIGKVLQNIH